MLSCPVAQQPPVTLRGRQQQRFIGQGVDKGIGSWGNSAPIGLNLRGVAPGKRWGNKKHIFSGKNDVSFVVLTLLFACLRICTGLYYPNMEIYDSVHVSFWNCQTDQLVTNQNSSGSFTIIQTKNNSDSMLQRPYLNRQQPISKAISWSGCQVQNIL